MIAVARQISVQILSRSNVHTEVLSETVFNGRTEAAFPCSPYTFKGKKRSAQVSLASHVRRSGANSLPFLRRRFRDDVFPQLSRFRHDARRGAASRTPRAF